MRTRSLFALALLLLGCSEQPWVFRNGVGLGDEPPARVVAEVYRGGDCGFACRPPGRQLYCEELAADTAGPAPDLVIGERYCFLGVAANAAGDPIAIGCTVATAGSGDAIEVTLSPVDETVQRATRCGPVIGLDGGLADAGARPDAGPPPDAGPGVDAGAGVDAGVDAGPPPVDSGPPPDDDVVLSVYTPSGGSFRVTSFASSRTWSVPANLLFNLGTIAGNTYRIEGVPDPGFVFDRFEGGGCTTTNPCDLIPTQDVRVDVYFRSE